MCIQFRTQVASKDSLFRLNFQTKDLQCCNPTFEATVTFLKDQLMTQQTKNGVIDSRRVAALNQSMKDPPISGRKKGAAKWPKKRHGNGNGNGKAKHFNEKNPGRST